MLALVVLTSQIWCLKQKVEGDERTRGKIIGNGGQPPQSELLSGDLPALCNDIQKHFPKHICSRMRGAAQSHSCSFLLKAKEIE